MASRNVCGNDAERPAAIDPGQRLVKSRLGGADVWIKDFRFETVRLGQRAHRLLAMIVRSRLFRPSPATDASGLVERELRKRMAFARSGIGVPGMERLSSTRLAVADVGETLMARMDTFRAAGLADRHDALLILAARALSHAHAAGVCHGRPHPRDMGLVDGRVLFFDFEEEPEAVMPLPLAQARDTMLLFTQVVALAMRPDTPDLAFEAYRQEAPARTLEALGALRGPVRHGARLGRLAARLHAGKDLVRFLNSVEFFERALPRAGKRVSV